MQYLEAQPVSFYKKSPLFETVYNAYYAYIILESDSVQFGTVPTFENEEKIHSEGIWSTESIETAHETHTTNMLHAVFSNCVK